MELPIKSSEPQEFDIIVSFNRKTNSFRIEMKNFDQKEECKTFSDKRHEFFKEFPNPELFFEFLETFHNKEKGWFQTEYYGRILDAYNRVSMLYYGKLFDDLIPKNHQMMITFQWQPFFWLIFLAKELNYMRLPDIYSVSDLETI